MNKTILINFNFLIITLFVSCSNPESSNDEKTQDVNSENINSEETLEPQMITKFNPSGNVMHVYNSGHIDSIFTAIKEGDTVFIHSGRYYINEELTIYKSAVIIGLEQVDIYCTNLDANVMWLFGDHIELHNLHLQHDPAQIEPGSYCSGNVVTLDITNEVLISNCELDGCGAVGVYENMSCDRLLLKNNEIHHNSDCAIYFNEMQVQEETNDFPGLVFYNNKIYENGVSEYYEGAD